MSKTLRKKLYKAVSNSPLKESAAKEFLGILHQAEEEYQRQLLALFEEDSTLAVIAYANIKKKREALQPKSSVDGREILADEFHLLTTTSQES